MKLIRKLKGNQKGFSLTEVLIAMAIFGIVGTSVMLALNASSKTIASAHEMTVAESLTRTIVEYVKRSPYDSTNDPPVYDSTSPSYVSPVDLNADPYYGDYTVDVDVERLDPEADGTGDDDGMQAITVEVSYDNRPVLTTRAYKVDR